jgi:hypothetical protein
MVSVASFGSGCTRASRLDSLAGIKLGIDKSPDLWRAPRMGDLTADCIRTEQTWSQVWERVVDIALIV